MKNSAIYCISMCFGFFGQIRAESISDPIVDFLSLPIDGRYTDASEIVRIDKISIDLDLDGQPEILVGHPKMWWGDNRGVYFSVYKKVGNNNYKRLTNPTEDIGLVFSDGIPQFVFVGRVDELGDTGLLVFNPPIGDAAMKERRTENNSFVSIMSGSSKFIELPALDLSVQKDREFFEKYSNQFGHQGGYKSESFTKEDLLKMGYKIPNWTKFPENQKAETTRDSENTGAISDSKSIPWIVGIAAFSVIVLGIVLGKKRAMK